jgi:hypothetical protein
MAKRRLTPVFVLSLFLGAMPLLTMNLETSPEAVASPAPTVTLRRPQSPISTPTAAAPGRALTSSRSQVLPLSNDSASLLVDELALRQLAHHADLELTDQQWTDFAIVASYYQAVRQAHEASIADIVQIGERRFRLHVPPYADFGDALRENFFAALRGHLGSAATERVARQMGYALEGYFGGFGISAQTLDFVAESGTGAPDYLVTRTVTFWNRVANQDRLSTRSEYHAPAVEDPTGRTWGPFLSLLSNYDRRRAGSS